MAHSFDDVSPLQCGTVPSRCGGTSAPTTRVQSLLGFGIAARWARVSPMAHSFDDGCFFAGLTLTSLQLDLLFFRWGKCDCCFMVLKLLTAARRNLDVLGSS
jgi:hypothetical protein